MENEILVETADGEWMLPVTIHTPPNVSSSSSSTLSPILLIAGWTGAASDWGALPKLLASRTRRPVVSYDARWIGQARPKTTTDSSSSLLSLHQMALDAETILHHLKSLRYEPPFCLLGNSLGGMIAQLLLLSSANNNNNNPPPPISSMILISTGSVAKPEYPASTDFLSCFDSWEDDGGSDTQLRRCAERFFEALGETYLAKPGRLKMRDRLVEHFVSTRQGTQAKEGIHAQKQALLRCSPTTAIVGKNLVPTLVLHGRNDRVFDYRNAYLLQDSMGSSCEVVVLPDSDHLLVLSDTASVVSNVETFLKDK